MFKKIGRFNDKKEKRQETRIFKNYLWIARWIFDFDKKYILIVLLFIIMTGIIPIITTILSQEIINSIQESRKWNTVLCILVAYIGIDLIFTVLGFAFNYYKTKFTLNFSVKINESMLDKISKLSLKSFENSETYDKISMAKFQGNGKILSYLEILMNMLASAITMSGYLIILLKFKIWIFPCITIIPVIKFAISKHYNLISFDIVKNRMNDSRKSNYLQYLLTYGDFYKELKIYNLHRYFINSYKEYVEKFNKQDIKVEKSKTKSLSVISVIESIIDGLLFLYVISYGVAGKILIGNVMTYMKTIMQIKDNLGRILESLSVMNKESMYIDQLFDFFHLPEEKIVGNVKIDKIKRISVRNLFYKYKSEADYVLKDVSLDINECETIAIVGQNGSGKTTLIKILMGFYDDYEGEIYINDFNFRDIDKKNYMSNIATLFQDFLKYEATYRENISYGNLKIYDNSNLILGICNKFGLRKLVENSDKGLDSQVGFWFDNGKQISLGQWQKLALCRAFSKEADLYFLDEPNAALDPLSEYQISKLYSKILQGHIGIIVAHKFNNFCEEMNRIFVLQDGKIVEQGKHEELIKNNYIYKELYEIQTGEKS